MKALVIIPTYNERENILRLIERVLNVDRRIEVLVVDDNSPDGTGTLVKEQLGCHRGLHLIERPQKLGIGPAYIAGFKWALEKGYDVVIEMDADLSHRPRYLPEFLRKIERYDVVVGSRWIRGGRIVNWSRRRVIMSRLANLYARMILGIDVHDLTGGFTAYRRKVLEGIQLEKIHSDGYSFQIEMKYRALRMKFSLIEIPITFTDRKAGDSKISRRIVWEAIFLVWLLKLQGDDDRRPVGSR